MKTNLSHPTVFSVKPALIRKTLREKFGLEELREGQAEIIDSVLKGRNTLAIMPTGAGKSLCFQLPALLMPGTTIVVSPLIALMKDQTEKLERLEIDVVELNSSLTGSEQSENVATAAKGKAEFLYVTPERLTSESFLKSIRHLKIDLMVIDEAHCISQWGHDFRPAYLALADAWRTLGQPRILALTATATDEVVEDIKKQLQLPEMSVFSSGVLRENLRYEAVHVENEAEKSTKILELLREQKGSGIIYCATVKAVEEVYDLLMTNDIPVDRYHGKMSTADRIENRQRFMAAQDRVIVATNAFGMGIDKPDIRFIIHFQFPGSLEAYYQESGRAGRDGLDSRCILIYLKQDKRTQSFFLAGRYPSEENMTELYEKLKSRNNQAVTESDLLKELTVPKSKAKVLLSLLKQQDAVVTTASGLKLARKTLSIAELAQMVADYRQKKESDQEKLKQMIIYAQSALCRWKMLLEYFGQVTEWERCQHCDNCERSASRLVEVG